MQPGNAPYIGHRSATYREVLAVREFRAVFVAQLLSIVGDQIAKVAVALLVFRDTGSTLLAALVYAVTYLTWLLGGPILATLGDRRSRRSILVACDATRGALVLAMTLPGLPIWVVLVLLTAVSVLAPPFESARAAVLPDVLSGDSYVVGSSLSTMAYQTGAVAGFAVGGALVAALSVPGALLIDAASFAASGLILRRGLGPHRPPAAAASRAGLLAETLDGLRYVAHAPVLRRLLLMSWVGAAFSVVPEGLAVAYVSDHSSGQPQSDAVATGLLTASVPLGIVLGAVLLGRLTAPPRRLQLMLPLAALSALPLALTGFDPGVPVAAGLWLVCGAGCAFQLAANASFVAVLDPARRARAFGVAQGGLQTVQGLSLAAAGAAAEFTSAATVIATSGVLGLLAIGWLGLAGRGRPAPGAPVPDAPVTA